MFGKIIDIEVKTKDEILKIIESCDFKDIFLLKQAFKLFYVKGLFL